MKKKTSFNLIILTIVILTIGLGVWKFNERFIISFGENKLISCREHVDKDLDMVCDVCHSELPLSNYAEVKSVKAVSSGDNKLEIYGYMPKNSNASISKIPELSAITTAKKYKKDILDEDVVAGFDISLDYNNKKYEPSKYSQKVDVKISNLDLDTSKTYALLHIIDENNYEILPIKEMKKDEITFTTGSFSTYIIITVGTNQVTFSGENFRVLDTYGNEITNGATVASGTDFSFNIVHNDNYGITGVSCSTADVMSSYGDINGRDCYISNVSENMTISVTTAHVPDITTQPVSVKIKQGGTAKFSVVASDATTYEWQYRENRDEFWKSVTSQMGSNYTSANFTLSSTGHDVSGYEFRCLVGNANFTNHERVKSDIVTVSIASDDIVVGEMPIVMVQPNSDASKIKVNSGKGIYSVTAMGGSDMTFTWQYRENREDLWKDITSTVATATTSTPSDSTTEKPLKKSTLTTVSPTYSLSGYEFRCLVGNSFYANHDAIKSDVVFVGVADDDIVLSSQMVNLKITKHPESQKIKLGDKATFSVTAVEAGSYKWQYISSGEELWNDVTSAMSSTYNKASMVLDTSSMTKDDNLSGARFRCVVTSSVVSGYSKISDEAVLSIAQGAEEKDISYAQIVNPENVTIAEGNDVKFIAGLDPAVSGIKYEWHEVSGDNDINLATLGTIYMSNNKGKANSTSSEKIIIKASGKATVSFDYMVSSEANDKFTVSIEDANGTTKAVDGISGIKNWATYSGEFTPNANGEVVLNLSYVKNGTIDAGEDYGAIKNLRCASEKSIDKTCTYVTDDTFKMTTPDSEAYDTSYTKTTHTWVADTTDSSIFKSNNKGVANSQATASVEINLPSVATLSFDYRVSSEGGNYDWTNISVVDGNGKTEVAKKLGGTTTAVTNWQTYTASVTPDSNGKVKILLLYRKDSSANKGDDIGAIRNIKVNGVSIVTSNCTFASDDVFTLENNYKAISYIGADTNTLTIPASLVTLAKNGYKYYCDMGGIVTAKATLNVTEDEKPKMITEWTIPSDNTEIKLPVQGTGLNIKIDWGDETKEVVTTPFPTHTYSTAGTYDITISGTCPEWGYNSFSSVNETSPYYAYTQYLTKVKQFGELSATQYGFSQCKNLTEVSGENLVTSKTFEKTTSMANMFDYCRNLTNLDVSRFDTSNVTSMSHMFDYCGNLTSLDVSRFDTTNVTDMKYMFYNCINLTSLDVSGFDTSKVTDMHAMFSYCSNLTSLDVSGFDTSNVTNMSSMFYYCSNLMSLDVSGFDTSKVIHMYAMFYYCSNLMSLDVSGFDTTNVTDMKYMFYNCINLTSLDVSGFDTSNVTYISQMFNNCRNLTSLDVSNFDTSNVTNMYAMFFNCSNLTSLDVSGFDTSNVTSMSGMFEYCSNLTSLDVSGFDTSNVTNMQYMFSYCTSLPSLDVSNFDTSDVTAMMCMFRGCSSLTSLDVSNFDTSNVTNMQYMFYDCRNLKSLQLSNKFAIQTTSNYSSMFSSTSNLSAIILIDETPLVGQFTNVKDQLDGKTFYVPNKVAETAYETSWSGDFTADRIEPMLKLVGGENIQIAKDSVYSDAGYTVAGFGIENSGDYTVYGYNVATSGDVDTSIAGIYEVTYSLTRNYMSGDTALTADISTETRNVEVIDRATYMITEWTIPSGDTTIKLPVQGTGLNIEVDWGDGTAETAVTTSFPTHTYFKSGEYDISIRGTCPKWGYNGSSSVNETSPYYTYTQYLTKVKQFGELSATQYGFSQCTNLTEVSGENLVTTKTFEKTTSMTNMFYNCSSLTSLDASNFNTSNVTDMSGMFDSCSSLISLDVSNFDTSNVKNMRWMFYGCSGLSSLNLSGFDTSKVTNMYGMFSGCSNLTSLHVSNFDTSKVTNMSYMFCYCSKLASIDVSNFDTSSVTNMSMMFFSCSDLTNLNVSNFNTSNVKTMEGMFGKCTSLKMIDVSNFETSKVTEMSGMFDNCKSLTTINVTNFDTSNVKYMLQMFSSCSGVTNLDLSSFDTSNVTDMSNMFYDCTNLKSLQLSNKFAIPTSNYSSMFSSTSNLSAIILIDETPLAGQFTNIKAQLDGKTFYVPSKVAETAYETSWSADFSGDRIQPILELVGVENVTIKVGETYTDAGYTIAGFTKADSGAYTCYGYSVSSSGEVNTAVAGKYKITYKVTRTYEKDGQTITTQPYEVTREITVMALPLTKPTLIGTYTYNGLIQTAQLKTVNESRFEITNNTRKDAGTQEITVSIKDKNTYAWEDGTTDDVKITWEIKPIIAEITWSATTIEYDGTAKTVTATVSNAVNGEVITVIEYEGTTTAVNVGEYTAKVKSLSSTNYTLEGAVNTEKKWYIQVTVIDMQVIMKDYSYGGTLPTPSITNNSAGRKVTYYYSENDTNQGGTDWSTVKDSLALPVGTYYMYAIVEANQNYQETLTDPVSFKVLGTELKVSVTKENKIGYDGNWVNQNVYIYITVEGNANVTAYQYKIGTNGSWIDKVTSPVILQNNMNGEVIVRGVNPAGKAVTSEKNAGLIKIDKTAPSITNVSYKNENKELSITATINDNLSGITAYAITAENGIREWIESTQGTKQAIVDGSGTYTIWAKDEAGNIGHETIDVVKDIHAPVGTIIVKDAYTVENNIYYTNQMNVILQITATDDISTSNQIKMAIYKEDDYNALTSEDEIVWEQYKENKQWTLTKENADEKIYLILKDMAGNISVKVGK